MRIIEKFKAKAADNMNNPPVTIAFLGDSVTQGCFELYIESNNCIETVFDKNSAYHNYIAKIFSLLYPKVPVNIVNAGISGDNAPHGYERLERDVLSSNPDLVVVCFGLNDCNSGKEGLEKYTSALENIFVKLQEKDKEIIFMTPNMMNTTISPHIDNELIENMARGTQKIQLDGILDMYIDAAREVCAKNNVPVCDCYAKWKKLSESSVDITELLANKINHPTRDMNWMFAYSLVEKIFE
ncbi:MAG: GDSL family lipase [Clostridia bacterium]|nr:GDSL family lipase [Clostridia bacterium]